MGCTTERLFEVLEDNIGELKDGRQYVFVSDVAQLVYVERRLSTLIW